MKLEIDIGLTPAQLAEAFCAMNDEEQAQFFIECVRVVEKTWERPYLAGMQWRDVGKHLATCECSSDEAREMVTDIADGIAQHCSKV